MNESLENILENFMQKSAQELLQTDLSMICRKKLLGFSLSELEIYFLGFSLASSQRDLKTELRENILRNTRKKLKGIFFQRVLKRIGKSFPDLHFVLEEILKQLIRISEKISTDILRKVLFFGIVNEKLIKLRY